MKILFTDIEKAPNLAYVWKLFAEDIPIQRLIKAGEILSWSAKWLGSDEYMYNDKRSKSMLREIWVLLDQADVVVTYNGKRFDIPELNKAFIEAGMPPPSPYKQIDLYHIVRREFRFPSNKLEYVAKALKIVEKIPTIGFELWEKCIRGDEEAWEKMKTYNIGDVMVLQALYNRLLPWIKNHPNMGLHNHEKHVCPNCGSHHVERRGYSYTAVGKYQRFKCKDCHTWSRDKKNIAEKDILVKDKN